MYLVKDLDTDSGGLDIYFVGCSEDQICGSLPDLPIFKG
jgi:hypothetical protein